MTRLTDEAKAIADSILPAKPTNVVDALSAVMRDLPAIGKDQTAAPQQGGYAYRGIEQITQHTQGLFAKYGVVFTPHVREWQVKDIVVAGKPWTDTIALVEYTVYGPGGADDRITVGPILAIGRDNSDKGANKCLTQAFKYALLQALCISDAKDDADGQTHEAELPPEPDPVDLHGWPSLTEQKRAWDELKDATTDETVKAWCKEQHLTLGVFTPTQADEWAARLAEIDGGDVSPSPAEVDGTSPASDEPQEALL